MATFDDLELEKLAAADKIANRKANTLGDGKLSEEPFGGAAIINAEDVFTIAPSVIGNFPSPDYADYPNIGLIATRRQNVRLHPLLASGKSGPQSVQTFVVVSSAPASNSPEDIEAVRIKHLVPPDFSMGRANAAEASTSIRGFELALYPAKEINEILEADTTNGPIPVSADPSTLTGVGDARWTVDYANGMVRLSAPAIDGGLFNPNFVYGDISGDSVLSGATTLFATFYQYTGGTVSNGLVTVGDGYTSYGMFNGQTEDAMQKAIHHVRSGTIHVLDGYYEYANSVTIPGNIRIVGMTKEAYVHKPAHASAFIIRGGNVDISGLTIRDYKFGSTESCIEISSAMQSQTIENINIHDNVLVSDTSCYGISISPAQLSVSYSNIRICNNDFKRAGDFSATTTYIGEIVDGTCTISNLTISDNTFGEGLTAFDGISLVGNGACITAITNLTIKNNYFNTDVGVALDINTSIVNFNFLNNTEVGTADFGYVNDGVISGNDFYEQIYLYASIGTLVFSDNFVYNANVELTTSSLNNPIIKLNNNDFGGWFVGNGDGFTAGSTISNNRFGSSFVINTTITQTTISDNFFAADANLGTIATSVVSGNSFSTTFQMTMGATRNTLSDNYIAGAATVTLTGTTTALTMVGNSLNSTLTFSGGTIANSEIASNRIGGTATFGTVTATSIVGNKFAASISLTQGTSPNRVAENLIGGSATLSLAASSGAISVENNIGEVATSITLDGTAYYAYVAGNKCADMTLGNLSTCTVINNYCTGNMFITGNIINSSVSNNIANDFQFLGSGTISASQITDNRIGTSGWTSTATINKSNLSNNFIDGPISFAGHRIEKTNFDNNKSTSSISGIHVITSSFTGNYANSISITLDNNSEFSNNVSEGAITLNTIDSLLTNALISNNTLNGALTLSSFGLSSCSIIGNDGYSVVFPNLTSCVVTNNKFISSTSTAAVTCGAITDSIIGNNIFSSTASTSNITFGAFNGARFTDNIIVNSAAQNVVFGSIDLSEISSCEFGGNDLHFGAITSSNMSLLLVDCDFYTDDTMAYTSLSNSTFYATANFNTGLVGSFGATRCSIANNIFSGDVVFNGLSYGILDSIFISNTCGDDVGFNVARGSSISDNFIYDVFGFDSMTDTVVSGNTGNGTLFPGIVVSGTIVGNVFFDGIAVVSTAVDKMIVAENYIGALMIVSGTITNSSFVGNYINTTSNLTSTWSGGGTFSGNQVTGAASFPGMTSVSITGNQFDSTVSFANAGHMYVRFVGNIVVSTFTGPSGAYTIENMDMSDNHFELAATISCRVHESTISNNTFGTSFVMNAADAGIADGALIRSVFSNNICGGHISILSSTANCPTPMYGSVFSGNRIEGDLTIQSASTHTNSVAMQLCTMNNNMVFGGLVINQTTGSKHVIYESSICGNVFQGTAIIGSAVDSTAGVYVFYRTTWSDNVMNAFGYFAASGRSVTTSTYYGSVIANNTFSGVSFRGEMFEVALNSNRINGEFYLGRVNSSTMIGNVVDSLASFTSFYSSNIANNNFGSTLATNEWVSTQFVGNYMTGAVTSTAWTDVQCSSNRFISTLSVIGASTVMNGIHFSANDCTGVVTIHSTTAGAGYHKYGVFTGNGFYGGLSLGANSTGQDFQKLFIIGNVIGSTNSLALHTVLTAPASAFGGVQIIGNIGYEGTLSIECSSNVSSPDTTSIIEFNIFKVYSGITWDDTKAVGWGSATSGSYVPGNKDLP